MPPSRIKGFQSNIATTAPAIRKEIEADIRRLEAELSQAKAELDWIDRIEHANEARNGGTNATQE